MVRRSGGGRKKLTSKYPGLMQALAEVLERSTYGDPQRVPITDKLFPNYSLGRRGLRELHAQRNDADA
jgi:hypothetical protein